MIRVLKEDKSYDEIRQAVRDYVYNVLYSEQDAGKLHVSEVVNNVPGYEGDWCEWDGGTELAQKENEAFENYVDALTDSYFAYYK